MPPPPPHRPLLLLRRLASPLLSSSAPATTNTTSSAVLSFTRSCYSVSASGGDAEFIATTFKDWFRKPSTVYDQIYEALSSTDPAGDGDGPALQASLSRLRFRLDEPFVLRCLRHTPRLPDPDPRSLLLLRLKFFHWAGRQPHYRHTRATYLAFFRLLSRASLVSAVLDWLHSFSSSRIYERRRAESVRFHETLVLGYAVAGQTETALQVLGRMRFQGIDLDSFSYNVLFNALVEDSLFDAADSVLALITDRGLVDPVTAFIRIKSLCKRGKIDEARAVLVGELPLGEAAGCPAYAAADRAVGMVVEMLCKLKRFEEARRLVEEFGGDRSYTVWLQSLISACRVDGAIEFLCHKKTNEGYLPEVFCYNRLICELLRENRLEEAYDVLLEMREDGIMPDRGTMNVALCFFCKAGLIDVAFDLYNSRKEFGLTPNSLAFNHLIYALCGDGSLDEACQVLEESMKQGYFPGKQTFRLIADMLCSAGKLDKMGKLLDAALKKNTVPVSTVCARYITALCRVGRANDGYSCLMASRSDSGSSIPLGEHAYVSLIHGFIALRRGDMICRLLLEMQQSGHCPSQRLYREIICCLCEMGSFDQVRTLLHVQLLRQELHRRTCYNYFIDGLGHAKRPEMVEEVYEQMLKDGVVPTMETQFLRLHCYMKCGDVNRALEFFKRINEGREPSKRMYNMLIVGLCKAGKPGRALPYWMEMREKGLIPSLHCYEELVQALCTRGLYVTAVKVLKDFEDTGRPVSSFLCNVLLLHGLKSEEFRQAWILYGSGRQRTRSQAGSMVLGDRVVAFSSRIIAKQHLDNLEDDAEKLFPVNLYTYNLLMKALDLAGKMDRASDLFQRICKRGYAPNRWTYDVLIQGLCRHGMNKDAEVWLDKMYHSGFCLTWNTMHLLHSSTEK